MIERSPDHWWVTTFKEAEAQKPAMIERSPDHWWVTTYSKSCTTVYFIERSPDHWWVTTTIYKHFIASHNWKVTRSLVSYDMVRAYVPVEWLDWKVTRSLVSYDPYLANFLKCFKDWKVTRSLVSYDYPVQPKHRSVFIERSPDHWWVTTNGTTAKTHGV